MYNDGFDFIELGTLVALGDGWYLDTDTNTKFQLDDNGDPIVETEEDFSYDDYYSEDDYNYDDWN